MVQNLQLPNMLPTDTTYMPPPAPALKYQRNGRKACASDLSVIVWDQARVSFLGTLDAAQWIEAITQGKSEHDEPWVEVDRKTQLFGKVSKGLQDNLAWKQYQFFVTFYHEGKQYSGYAVLRKRPDDFALLHLENGFEEIA